MTSSTIASLTYVRNGVEANEKKVEHYNSNCVQRAVRHFHNTFTPNLSAPCVPSSLSPHKSPPVASACLCHRSGPENPRRRQARCYVSLEAVAFTDRLNHARDGSPSRLHHGASRKVLPHELPWSFTALMTDPRSLVSVWSDMGFIKNRLQLGLKSSTPHAPLSTFFCRILLRQAELKQMDPTDLE